MVDHIETDKKIIEGHEYLEKNKKAQACDIWLDAWEGVKLLMAESNVNSVAGLNHKYRWSELPVNYAQELEQELHNAGLGDPIYFEKRIEYCYELLKYVGDDELMEGNTRRGIADSYFELGNTVECDRLYGQWLDEDPLWGWGYIGWAMCYENEYSGKQNIEKVKNIIERAVGVAEVRDRLDVVDYALSIYEEHDGGASKIEAMRSEFARLNPTSPGLFTRQKAIPVTIEKIGRNDPCPCGSGKKYKKCHGQANGV